MTIRALKPGDLDAWRPLWDGYLRFYREELPEATTLATFERLCARRDGMAGLVAVDDDGGLLGFAHVVVHPSTWSRTSYAYLEDLFVAETGRRSGTGRALIEAVTAHAAEAGAEKVYWHTEDHNARARSLYDAVATLTAFQMYERPVAT